MKKLFTSHPADVNETYSQHMAHAGGFGFRMIGAGFACLVHAVFPFLFVTTGSRAITGLHDRMVTNRGNLTPAPDGTSPVSSNR